MKSSWQSIKEILIGVIVVAVGVLLIKYSVQAMEVIVIIGGVFAIIHGINSLVNMKNITFLDEESKKKLNENITLESIISIALGVLAIIFSLAFAKGVWIIFAYILGIYLLIEAILKLRLVVSFKKYEFNSKEKILEAIIEIGFAILLFIAPQKIGAGFMKIIGWIVLIIGVVELLIVIFQIVKKHKEKVEMKNNEGESEPLN